MSKGNISEARRDPGPESEGGVIQFDPNEGETSAQLCRENGWGVGTVLEPNSRIQQRMRITAIGEAAILATMIGHRIEGEPWRDCRHRDHECNLIDGREWKAVIVVPAP